LLNETANLDAVLPRDVARQQIPFLCSQNTYLPCVYAGLNSIIWCGLTTCNCYGAIAILRLGAQAMMSVMPNVLIVDDDPNHLKIYGWILERAELRPVPCLVKRRGLELPKVDGVELVILDYALHCGATPVEVAEKLREEYPQAPIVLLSDVNELPEDVEPYVQAFVRKGNPESLVSTVMSLLGVAENERV
jgi:CheY-like chemotaxis protein